MRPLNADAVCYLTSFQSLKDTSALRSTCKQLNQDLNDSMFWSERFRQDFGLPGEREATFHGLRPTAPAHWLAEGGGPGSRRLARASASAEQPRSFVVGGRKLLGLSQRLGTSMARMFTQPAVMPEQSQAGGGAAGTAGHLHRSASFHGASAPKVPRTDSASSAALQPSRSSSARPGAAAVHRPRLSTSLRIPPSYSGRGAADVDMAKWLPPGFWRRKYMEALADVRRARQQHSMQEGGANAAVASVLRGVQLRYALDCFHWLCGAGMPALAFLAALLLLGERWNFEGEYPLRIQSQFNSSTNITTTFVTNADRPVEPISYSAVFGTAYVGFAGIFLSHFLVLVSLLNYQPLRRAEDPAKWRVPGACTDLAAGELRHPWGLVVKGMLDNARLITAPADVRGNFPAACGYCESARTLVPSFLILYTGAWASILVATVLWWQKLEALASRTTDEGREWELLLAPVLCACVALGQAWLNAGMTDAPDFRWDLPGEASGCIINTQAAGIGASAIIGVLSLNEDRLGAPSGAFVPILIANGSCRLLRSRSSRPACLLTHSSPLAFRSCPPPQPP